MKISADELEPLFDALPDVVFFVKDTAGRYTHANLTLLRRLGLKQRSDIIGKSVTELFPATMGGSYAAQDGRVLMGETIENQLEVHIFANRVPGWCLTCKRPLRSRGKIQGLIGISRDLGIPDGKHPTYDRLKRVLTHMQGNYAEGIRVQALAELAGLSIAQLERHFRRVFQLTPQQVLTKLRIEAAMRLLRTDETVASIGMACGFGDQSAFARQFKATVGMSPRVYRTMVSANDANRP
ncbi:AraC family transcriptional regulator [Dyella sp. 2HG41-7]|uniref:AraC family transcriptional regulator n=1 Tax=Dyella sp. 2HG41-7 TaxID=2883239 RepID=UPI001F202100|nr:AraC family transcriptional regulator [Dyella sp. 2HG41-7]